MSAKAEDAAKACEKHGSLSHDIGHSTDKCNLAGGSGMVNSVAQYINDHGENNRERRGHRAWCLNPPMDKVDFGEAGGGYSAMWCRESYLVELLREENAWIVDISALFNNIPAVMVIAMTEGTLTRRFSALLTSRLPCA